MTTIVKRVVGALLAVLGLGLIVTGAWFATQLGSSGTAQFTARPATSDPVLIRPDVLNRVDADVVVTATPEPGATVWMALANPSDAAAVLGDARHVAATGVGVRDWVLLTRTVGTGEATELGAADLWRQQDSAEGPVTLTVQQDEAPETLVIATQGGDLETLTFTVVDKTWFVEAVVAVLAGLFLLLAGLALLWPRRAAADDGAGSGAGSGAGAAAVESTDDGVDAVEPTTEKVT
jgi:hypothetical protein